MKAVKTLRTRSFTHKVNTRDEFEIGEKANLVTNGRAMAAIKLYAQKYCKQWEQIPELKEWTMPVVGDPTKAACRLQMDRALDNYFSHLNSLSLKIARDINGVKSTYDRETWHALTFKDQENILNNYFIKQDICNKYKNKSIAEKTSQVKSFTVYSYNGQDLHTYIYQNVGMKILHDENHAGDCRDEHSFPFSYRTKSQINIPSIESKRAASPIINVSKSVKSIKSESLNNTKKLSIVINITEAPHYKRDDDLITNSIGEYDNDQQSNETSQLLFERVESTNSNLTDFCDSDNEFKEGSGQEEKDKLLSPSLNIPKGFDFLSNW